MRILKFLLNIFVSLITLALCILGAAHLTGHDKRTYPVLKATDLVIAGTYLQVEKLAQLYEPEMYLRPNTSTPPLKWVWYEVTPTDSIFDITYHYCWENEINPNKFYHAFYSIYRAAYFGYPLYDIEYFEIKVNKKDGQVQGIHFETSPSDDFYPSVVKHIPLDINWIYNGYYYNKESITPLFDSMHVKVGVQTWNHLSCLLNTDNRAEYSQLLQAPLKYLSDDEFSQYKFARKSQGEHFTEEDKTNLYLYSFAFILGALATLWHIFDFKKSLGILRKYF